MVFSQFPIFDWLQFATNDGFKPLLSWQILAHWFFQTIACFDKIQGGNVEGAVFWLIKAVVQLTYVSL